MECIGYAFSLPIENHTVISSAISLYKDWLLYKEKRPECFKSNEEYYQKEILCHFSLVFNKKKDPKKHAELCSDVLNIIKTFIRTQQVALKT